MAILAIMLKPSSCFSSKATNDECSIWICTNASGSGLKTRHTRCASKCDLKTVCSAVDLKIVARETGSSFNLVDEGCGIVHYSRDKQELIRTVENSSQRNMH